MKMKFFKYWHLFLALPLFCFSYASAQPINEIAQTEFDFAKDAKSRSFVYSFNKYAAPNAIWFNPAISIVQEDLKELRKIPSYTENAKLRWWPHHIGIAKSGDFGFDLGPWYIEDSQKAGFYFTIWNNIAPGIWAYSLDTGVGTVKNRDDLPKSSELRLFQKIGKSNPKSQYIAIENEANNQLKSLSAKDISSNYFLDDALIGIEGKEFSFDRKLNQANLQNLPIGNWRNNGFQFAASGDMAASFGDISDNNGKILGEYIRLWFTENKIGAKPKIYIQLFRPRT